MKKHIQKIESVTSHDEKQILALQGFIDLFEFSSAGLYFYSTLSKIGEGILRLDKLGVSSLREVREDVRSLPPIYSAIRERKPKHVHSQLIRQIPIKYHNNGKLTEFLVVPLVNSSSVVGYTCLMRDGSLSVGDSLLQSLKLYGEHVGRTFGNDDHSLDSRRLSKREIEVLQRLSWGESTKELAISLNISEFTIRDYVKSSIQKLDVLNRVQGVAEALRRGIIQ